MSNQDDNMVHSSYNAGQIQVLEGLEAVLVNDTTIEWRVKVDNNLGFEPSKFGFDSSSPAHLYVVSLNLIDGTQSTMFGITNRTPKQRYKLKERNLMQDRITYKFPRGGDALKLETLLRREFKEFSAGEGQSPLLFKKGTAGEILRNVPLEFVTEMLKEYSGEHLPTPEPW